MYSSTVFTCISLMLVSSVVSPLFAQDWAEVGHIEARHAKDIEASMISIGAETMCRDFSVYKHWKHLLGPLGAKSARIQSGWGKTEKQKGQYSWAWHDEVIDDMIAQGVQPWVCLSYGNPIYKNGGNISSSSPLPKKEALEAWDQFVTAMVTRYKDRVHEWEIWNEPIHKKIKSKDYADFAIRTAKIIRAVQPEAEIFFLSSAGVPWREKDILKRVDDLNQMKLFNGITYHPYRYNPDEILKELNKVKKDLKKYNASHLTLFQGENGAPSARGSKGALTDYDWTETSQAKWLLRRMICDLGQGMRTSYFTIVDLHYRADDLDPNSPLHMNTKGLIATNPDKTVDHPKKGYYAMQHLTAIFDNQLKLGSTKDIKVNKQLKVYRWNHQPSQQSLVVLWNSRRAPKDGTATKSETITVPLIDQPVYVDLLSGKVHSIPPQSITKTDQSMTIAGVPVGDWPVMITSKAALVSFKAKQSP